MTTITATAETASTTTTVAADRAARRRFPLLRAGVVSGAVAAAATTLVAVVARALDVPLAVAGESIPLAGFAQLTMVGAVVGVAIGRLCGRTRHPRQAFVATTIALTALSFVPDVTADATTATKAVLMLTHLVAAAIVVPVLAARVRP
jgi:hypothetical protein